MREKSYVTFFLFGLFALYVTAVGVNFVIDPYDLNGKFRWKSINEAKPEVMEHLRLYKVLKVAKEKPAVIALGTSRTASGISMDHPGWLKDGQKINFATFGSNSYEIMRNFIHAEANQSLKQVIFGLDFFAFNIYMANAPDFDESVLYVKKSESELFQAFDEFKFYASFDTLMSSIKTIKRQNSTDDNSQKTDQHSHFVNSEVEYLTSSYLPPPRKQFDFTNKAGQSTLDHFRKIVELARRDHVDLRLFISPSHARQWEVMRVLGLWPKFEDWKRELVKILNKDALSHPDEKAFPLWDFSGYNSVTTESVPSRDDSETRMRWYVESSHYTQEAGNMILDRLFNYRDTRRTVPDDFGVLLTAENIEDELAGIREKQRLYIRAHASDVLEIRQLAIQHKVLFLNE